MKQQRVTRTRCECDHCGKVNHSPAHMAKHERHCTRNPDRECGFCGDPNRTPTPEIAQELLQLAVRDTRFSYLVNSDDVIEKLIDLTEGCPACALAAMRLSGLYEDLPCDLYKKLKEDWWDAENDAARQGIAL